MKICLCKIRKAGVRARREVITVQRVLNTVFSPLPSFWHMLALSEIDAFTTDDIEMAICINHKCMKEVIGQDLSPSFDCQFGVFGTWVCKQQAVQAQMNSDSYVRTQH